MTTRQPRRARRRAAAPATGLPRPVATASGRTAPAERSAATLRHREHHVTTDYSYVHKDLILVASVGSVVLAFIVGMSFVLTR
jgi:hypothetical protein